MLPCVPCLVMSRWWLVVVLAAGAAAAGTRLPRTSAASPAPPATPSPAHQARQAHRNLTLAARSSVRNREQYIFNVFEVIVSTLETKLQRIENLDKAVEHLMRRVEAMDSRVNDNIHKTDAIISKLGNLDFKLFSHIGPDGEETATEYINKRQNENTINDAILLDRKLESLDQKVSDIDSKLVGLKNQIDNNFLPVDDINAEASEKKPINLNVIEIAKGLNTEVINEITKEVDQLRTSMSTVDRKLQFHINLVSENLGKVLYMMADVHAAIVEPEAASINVNSLFKNRTATSTQAPASRGARGSKIDTLVNKIIPMMSVSEKMDEVWDVVVGTKSSVDDLVPKSDELLTQTQRQERAIGQIHNDLRVKTNLIIENLDMVEKRLKKQEDDVATLAQRPVPAELLLDPTIDRLVEYAPSRYRLDEPEPATSTSTSTSTSTGTGFTTTPFSAFTNSPSNSSPSPTVTGGIIFPSVKNKPIIGNNTFASEIVANYKDVKGFSCVDLLNAGMRDSGVYYLQIRGTTYWFLKVYCEQNIADGGWTVIHRRDDFGVPAENFNRDWSDYKNGFGDSSKEFWLGNENIYMLTNNDDYMLRVELEDFDGNKRGSDHKNGFGDSSKEFWLGNENIYMLTNNDAYMLRVELEDFDGNKSKEFWLGNENIYMLTNNDDYMLRVELEDFDGNKSKEFWLGNENIYMLTNNDDYMLRVELEDFDGNKSKEFWLGNENIYMLTNNDDYMLRVELEDFDGNKRYAQYSHFKIYSEAEYYKLEIDGYEGNAGDSLNDPWYGSNNSPFSTYNRSIYSEAEYYKLEIDGYEGNAGDSLNDPWYGSNNSPFSTYNRDNDRSSLNCASMLKGGWWWKSCGRGLNGLYLHDPQDLTARQGIVWFRWRGWDYTLKRASMMIKPKGQSNT
ncbi:hypothetical protein NE865_10309 [Phthorimaea operculella]|nr:hypothetical protein NE865_10309 [Phthorimaea operculella]